MELLSKLRRRKALLQKRASGKLLSALSAGLLLLSACTNDPVPPPDEEEPVLKGASYTMYAHNLRDVRKGESLHLWAKYKGDSTWSWMTRLTIPRLFGDDSSRLAGRYKFSREIGDLEKLMISLEVVDSPTVPDQKLIAGAMIDNTALLRPEDQDGVGDYSTLAGSVIFTSNSGDPLRYLQEFYFARRENGVLVPSLSQLPELPLDWKYAIWVSDSSFFPEHKFFYGYLESPALPDSRSSKDTYPLPGGFEGPLLERETAQIRVTLEPPTMQATLAQAGPSPYSVLFTQLPKKLEPEMTLEMINLDQIALPVVKFTLKPD
ncbi:MAG TPA: hypothetical protein VFH43_09960 [Candidatus Kapabacteria bacterium]|nr:hypothetical protein [Candidatus Kapabacteria bacterium]